MLYLTAVVKFKIEHPLHWSTARWAKVNSDLDPTRGQYKQSSAT